MPMFDEIEIPAVGGQVNVAVGARNGPPLLFLHGVCRRWTDFLPILPAVAPRWQVHAMDHRGHGKSGRVAGVYQVTDYVADVAELLRTAFSEPVVIYGHSLGAMVACGAAAVAPEAVRAVVLEDPPFETLGRGIFATPFHPLFRGMRECAGQADRSTDEVAAQMAEIRLPGPDGPGTVRLGDVRDPAQLRFGARCLQLMDRGVLDPVVEGRWLEGYETDSVLPRVTCPALLLVGETERGGMLPVDEAARAARLMAHSMQIGFAGAGHLIHWTHTEELLRFLLPFLESLR